MWRFESSKAAIRAHQNTFRLHCKCLLDFTFERKRIYRLCFNILKQIPQPLANKTKVINIIKI